MKAMDSALAPDASADIPGRIDALDWNDLGTQLDCQGSAVAPGLFRARNARRSPRSTTTTRAFAAGW